MGSSSPIIRGENKKCLKLPHPETHQFFDFFVW